MAVLFHQNMRRYGGGSAPRNNAYYAVGNALGGIVAGLGMGVGPVAVAGFTEIVNNGAAAGALAAACGAMGINFIGNVSCGRTALAKGSEFIGLGLHATYGLDRVGRILFQAGRGGITLLHQRDTTAANLRGQGYPAGMSADYRGLVYVTATIPGGGGNKIAVGFLHNMFTMTAQRTLVAGQLGNLMNMMGAAIPSQGLGPVPNIIARYIGGDFNVHLINPRSGFDGYSALPPGYPAGAVPGGTTYRGSLYDYWYSSIPGGGPAPGGLMVPVPSASSATLDSGYGAVAAGLASRMSDHVAIMLRIS